MLLNISGSKITSLTFYMDYFLEKNCFVRILSYLCRFCFVSFSKWIHGTCMKMLCLIFLLIYNHIFLLGLLSFSNHSLYNPFHFSFIVFLLVVALKYIKRDYIKKRWHHPSAVNVCNHGKGEKDVYHFLSFQFLSPVVPAILS